MNGAVMGTVERWLDCPACEGGTVFEGLAALLGCGRCLDKGKIA